MLHIITGLESGGAEAVLFRLVVAHKNSGNSHHVVSLMNSGVYAEKLRLNNVCVDTLEFVRGQITLSGLLKLFFIIRNLKPDVVQTWMYHADLIGGLISRLAGVRSLVWGIRHANLEPAHNSRSTLLIARMCGVLSVWIPRKIVFCSLHSQKPHLNLGYKKNKFVYIPNGYDLEKYNFDLKSRQQFRSSLKIKDDVFLLGIVARFDIQKDHQNLIRALGHFKKNGGRFICLLVGIGMDQANAVLHAWIDEAGVADDVVLLGPRTDIPAVMNAVDVHVLSSLGEAFPNVLAEAMACGTPCVTTDVGDAAVIVANYGWVVARQDSVALASGIMDAYEYFKIGGLIWEQRKIKCRLHIVENFELQKMCDRYHEVWMNCMQEPS